MKKIALLFIILMLVSLLVLTGCSKSDAEKSIDLCVENCQKIDGATKEQCVSQCENALGKFDAQSEELETNGKKDPSCERFSSQMAKESCYLGLAMDTGDAEYCDNIANSATRMDCQYEATGDDSLEPNPDGFGDMDEVAGVVEPKTTSEVDFTLTGEALAKEFSSALIAETGIDLAQEDCEEIVLAREQICLEHEEAGDNAWGYEFCITMGTLSDIVETYPEYESQIQSLM